MNEFTMYCLVIAGALLLLAYILNRPDTKAKLQVIKKDREKEQDLIYQYEKRIKELEDEIEMLIKEKAEPLSPAYHHLPLMQHISYFIFWVSMLHYVYNKTHVFVV